MNPSDVSRLLLDLWKDLHDVRVLWQLTALAIVRIVVYALGT